MPRSFYEVLGVSEAASEAEIQDAYRNRLKETHPDHNDDENADEQTKRLIQAHDILINDAERERYDDLGHAAYIRRHGDGLETEQVPSTSDTATATNWTDSSAGPSNKDGVGVRQRARERRRRERQATTTVGGGNTAHAASTEVGETSDGSDMGAASRTRMQGSNVAGSKRWNAHSGFNVRRSYEEGLRRNRIFPSTQSVIMLVTAFVIHPFLIFSALFRPFPLLVNLIIAVCLVLLIGYLQSMPEVGIAVFGCWSVGVPLGLLQLQIPLTSLTGVLALAATWLPLGLSAITFVTIRQDF
jgi:curved DNA-binding protein CbpA